MEEIIKISILGIVSVILALILSEKAPFFSTCVILVAGVYILTISLSTLSSLINSIYTLMTSSGIESDIFEPIIKVCAIAIIVKITGDICKDSGHAAVATKVQFAGSISSIICVFPLFVRIIDILKEII